jgi:amyloid beta A4 protein
LITCFYNKTSYFCSYPELATKIRALMEDYLQALRSKDETPGSLLTMTRDAEAAILDKFRADVQARQEGMQTFSFV